MNLEKKKKKKKNAVAALDGLRIDFLLLFVIVHALLDYTSMDRMKKGVPENSCVCLCEERVNEM